MSLSEPHTNQCKKPLCICMYVVIRCLPTCLLARNACSCYCCKHRQHWLIVALGTTETIIAQMNQELWPHSVWLNRPKAPDNILYWEWTSLERGLQHYCSVLGNRGSLPAIHVYGGCYIDPMKRSAWVLAWNTIVVVKIHKHAWYATIDTCIDFSLILWL